MNIVIAKLESCGQKSLFRLPDNKYLEAGELVSVETKQGIKPAMCLCDSFNVQDDSYEMDMIYKSFNVKNVLPQVVGYYSYYEFTQ